MALVRTILFRISGGLLICGVMAFLFLIGNTVIKAQDVNVEGEPVTRLYVKEGGTGDGSSWDDAAGDLAQMILQVIPSSNNRYEIWVAKGTYYPHSTSTIDERDQSFRVKQYLSIYGGFAGDEIPGKTADEVRQVLEQRDFELNETILSGDIGVQGDDSDNSYHVIDISSSPGKNKLLDGFTITGGNANNPQMITIRSGEIIEKRPSSSVHKHMGGGMKISNSDMILRNIVFADNHAGVHVTESSEDPFEHVFHETFGGAIYSENSDIELENVIFRNNSASITVADDVYLSAHLTKAVGGAIYQDGGKLTLNGVLIENNVVFVQNAAVYEDSIYQFFNIGQSEAYAGGLSVTGNVDISLNNVRIFNNRVEAVGNRGQDAYAGSPASNVGSKALAAGGGMFIYSTNGEFSAYLVELRGNQAVATGGKGGSVFDNMLAFVGEGGEALARGGGAVLGDMTGPGQKVFANWLIADNEVIARGGAGGDVFVQTGVRLLSKGGRATGRGGGLEMGFVQNSAAVNLTIAHNHLTVTPGEGSSTDNAIPAQGERIARGAGLNVHSGNQRLFNSVIWGNRERNGSGAASPLHENIQVETGAVNVAYSIVEDATDVSGDWTADPWNVYDFGHNLDQDPLFVDVNGQDYRLQRGSPGIELGDTSFYRGGHESGVDLSALTTDLAGAARISGWEVDLGAYEYAFDHTPGPAAFKIKSITTDEAILEWQSMSDARYYELYRFAGEGVPDAADEGAWELIEQIPNDQTTYLLANLQQGQTYYFALRVEMDDGASGWTDPLIVEPKMMRWFVNEQKPAGGDGTTWATAFPTLAEALLTAHQSPYTEQEIWVAAGTYYPVYDRHWNVFLTDPRTATFQLQNGLSIYGGFAGVEEPAESEEGIAAQLASRDLNKHLTILSGDIGVQGDHTDNAYHVFEHRAELELNQSAILDGVIIRDGYADGEASEGHHQGAGMLNIGNSPLLRHVIIEENHVRIVGKSPTGENGEDVSAGGAGMYNESSHPVLQHVIFRENTVEAVGGEGSREVMFTTIIVYDGGSGYAFGAGLYNVDSSPALQEVEFVSNSSQAFGGNGGVFNNDIGASGGHGYAYGGAMANEGDSQPLLENVHFIDNFAYAEGGAGGANYAEDKQAGEGGDGWAFGGALANLRGSEPILNQVQFVHNRATAKGGNDGAEMRNTPDPPFGEIDLDLSYSGNGISHGGAIYHEGGSGSWVNLTFIRNQSEAAGGDAQIYEYLGLKGGDAYATGGALYLADGTLFVTNAVFSENELQALGGDGGTARKPLSGNVIFPGFGGHAFGRGGAIFAEDGQLVLTNATIVGQHGEVIGGSGGEGKNEEGKTFWGQDGQVWQEGGAIYSNLPENQHHVIRNSIIWNNMNSAIYTAEGRAKPVMLYSLIQDSGGSEAWAIDEHALDGWNHDGHNVDADPLFIAPGYELSDHSPAIDQGSNDVWRLAPEPPALYPDLRDISVDVKAQPRIVGHAVDLGAYENQNHLTDDPGLLQTLALYELIHESGVNTPLEPLFSSEIFAYQVRVASDSAAIQWMAAADPDVTIELRLGNGSFAELLSGVKSPLYELEQGENRFTFRISNDRVTQRYEVIVFRERLSIELPSPPQAVKAQVITDTSAIVTFEMMPDETVDEYEVIVWEEGVREVRRIRTTVHSLTVEHLQPGVGYTFTVAAMNEAGASIPSDHSNYIVMQAEDTPPFWLPDQELRFEHVGVEEIGLAWPAAQDDQMIQHYFIYVDESWHETVTGNVYEYRVTGLLPETEYLFSVYAVDAAGNASIQPLEGKARTLMKPDDTDEDDEDDEEQRDEQRPPIWYGGSVCDLWKDGNYPAGSPCKEDAGDAHLESLIVTAGDQALRLEPVFSPDVQTYRVSTDQDRVFIQAIPSSDQAKLFYNGEQIEGIIEVRLKWGETHIQLDVEAGKETKQTYHLILERKPLLSPLPFTDLEANHWSYEAVQFIHGLGMIEGYPDETFRADHIITRAEYVVMLMNMLELLEPAEQKPADSQQERSFADQDAIGDWAWPAIEKALKASIVNGYEDGTFQPQAPIQCSEMIAMLSRTTLFQSLLMEHPEREYTSFRDESQIPEWALESVRNAQSIGIIQGRNGHIFDPSALATRAEIAVLMKNFFQMVIESSAYQEEVPVSE